MNTTLVRTFLALGALGWTSAVLPAQDAKTESSAPAVRELIEQLGDRSYQNRRAAESALRARGTEALDALREAAKDDADPEVQWRARRLVRQIEGGEERQGTLQPRGEPRTEEGGTSPHPSSPWMRMRPFQLQGGGDLEQVFGDLFEQLERDFGVDVPRGRFFHDDFFRNLQQQMDDMQQGGAMQLPGGQAFSMRMDQDGVRLEITEKGQDGKSETKVYEAPDMQAFRDKYPEIAQRYLRDGGVRVFGFEGMPLRGMPGFGGRFQVAPLAPRGMAPLPGTAGVGDDGERLGVLVDDVPEAVREFLNLDQGQGLRVVEVTEGSLAETLGVQSGDVLLEVAGRAIATPLDVREGLESVEAGDKLTVKINRRGAETTLETAKPKAPPAEKADAGQKKPAGKLEKRDGGVKIR